MVSRILNSRNLATLMTNDVVVLLSDVSVAIKGTEQPCAEKNARALLYGARPSAWLKTGLTPSPAQGQAQAPASAEGGGGASSSLGRTSSLSKSFLKTGRRTTRKTNSAVSDMALTSTTNVPTPPHLEASNSQTTNSTNAAASGGSIPLLEKLLCRLKSLKRSHSHNTHVPSEQQTKNTPASLTSSAPTSKLNKRPTESNVLVNAPPVDTLTTNLPTNEPLIQEEPSSQKHVIALAEYSQLCEQLGLFLQQVRETQEIATFTGTFPSTLQRRLDQDALELRSLYDQVREALRNIVRVKEQRRAVRKERIGISKALVKIRDQEVREMEGLISQYDKVLLSRWEKLKSTLQPELLENFLNDIKGKQQALDHMNTLVNQKLSQLTNPTAGSPTTTTTSSTFSGSGLLTALRDETKAGSSTTTNRRNSVSGCIRTNATRWRKHHERGTRSSSNAQESLPLSLVPLALNSTPAPSLGITIIPLTGPSATTTATTAVTTAATTATSSSNSLPSSLGSLIIPPNTPSAQPQTEEEIVFNVPGSSTESGSLNLAGPACSTGGLIIGPTMPERRSMLQALFGDLRRSTELNTGNFVTLNHLGTNGPVQPLGPVSTTVVVTSPEESQHGSIGRPTNNGNNERNRDIELFSLNRPT